LPDDTLILTGATDVAAFDFEASEKPLNSKHIAELWPGAAFNVGCDIAPAHLAPFDPRAVVR